MPFRGSGLKGTDDLDLRREAAVPVKKIKRRRPFGADGALEGVLKRGQLWKKMEGHGKLVDRRGDARKVIKSSSRARENFRESRFETLGAKKKQTSWKADSVRNLRTWGDGRGKKSGIERPEGRGRNGLQETSCTTAREGEAGKG